MGGLGELIGKIIFLAYFFTLKEKDTAKSYVFVGGLRNDVFFLIPFVLSFYYFGHLHDCIK